MPKEIKEKIENWEKDILEKTDFKIYNSPLVQNSVMAKLLKEEYDQWILIIRQLLSRRDKMWQKRIKAIEELNKLSKKVENL